MELITSAAISHTHTPSIKAQVHSTSGWVHPSPLGGNPVAQDLCDRAYTPLPRLPWVVCWIFPPLVSSHALRLTEPQS